jgi:ABC-type transport system involved in multi-copper enzyme maturation permease subunit
MPRVEGDLMTFLPVIGRELRRRSRRRLTYWTRVGVALGGVLVAIPPFISSDFLGSASPTDTGAEVFNSIVAAMFVVCAAACLVTADVIGQERRDGTLGLLILARVRGLDLLLGKLGSAGIAGLGALATFLPVLMLPVLAGGVTGGEAFRKGLALLSTLIFALALGLFASACRNERFQAARLAVGSCVCLMIVPWLFLLVMPPAVNLITGISPLVLTIMASDSEYQAGPEFYWSALGMVNLLALMFLIVAAVRIRRTWVDKEEGVRVVEISMVRPVPLPKRWRFRGAAFSDPVAWLVSYQRGFRLLPWWAALIFTIYLSVSWMSAEGTVDLSASMYWLLYAVASAGTDALLAIAAGQFFLDSRRSGQLEVLLTTPAGTTLMKSHWRALRKRLRWPVLFLVVTILLHTTAILRSVSQSWISGGGETSWGFEFPVSWALDAAGTLAEVGTACWLGMWLALRGEGRLGIAGWAAMLATGVPFLFRLGLWLGVEPALTEKMQSWGWFWPWIFTEWMGALLAVTYYWCLYRFAKDRVSLALRGVEQTTPGILKQAGSVLRGLFGWSTEQPERRGMEGRRAEANYYP